MGSAALLESVLIRSPEARALSPVLWEQFSLKFSRGKKKKKDGCINPIYI